MTRAPVLTHEQVQFLAQRRAYFRDGQTGQVSEEAHQRRTAMEGAARNEDASAQMPVTT